MRASVLCSVPALPCCRPTHSVRRFASLLLVPLLLLLSSSISSGSSIGAVPSPFQLAPDTPAPAEPTPTQPTPRPDPCVGRPCLNAGECLALPSAGRPEDTWEYTCTCSQGFTGRNCEFFTDPCTSSPCLHGNCSRSSSGEEGEPAYTCECGEGYEGERCDQILLDLPAADWDPATPSAPGLATPVASTTAAATQPSEPTTIPSTTTPVPPTLQPWQPKPGQRLLVVPWEADRVTESLHCVSPELCELTSGTLTVSLEVPEETAVKVVVNASGAPELWRLNEEGFLRSSISNGTVVWFLQAPDGLVVPDHSLPLGQNYFLSVMRVGAPTAPEVTLRLNLTVKASSCVEPGSSFSDPQCSGKGKCITQPSESTFFCECEDGYTGIFCEEFDACLHRPCHNNGTCTDVRQGGEGRNFTCSCTSGYEGERCQLLVDHCLSQPCKNGATCFSSLAGPRCYCPEGYQGATCEQKVDPCASSPCHNNGTCYAQGPGPLGFGCSCTAGFTGPTCAQLVDFCALNPCAHGVCRSIGNSYRCLCVPGYHGLYCEEEYNECLSAPCQNYATCRDLINAYECVCTPQFEGRHCEIYRDPCLKVSCQNGGRCESTGLNASCACPPGYLGEECEVDINDCESNPCHHGGTCIDQSNGFTCHCPPGWVGPNCEIHLQWKPAHTEDTLTNMPRHSLYIIIGALCVAFVLMLIILIVGICRISRIEYQGSSRHAYQEFYNCRSIDSEFSNAIASIRHARFGKKSRPAMYDATPIAYEDYSPDDKPLVTLIKTKDL
ncbi:delta and Notch-like epidermal growth factor-related receptor isoform X1 [Hippoglossus hippoglossus]|uniref:delta and Notch-like epidermal growth factor-related receptor n=1 Tax=Hippoglossus stenolepis TaxID=195615 RepID=UPI00148D726C|nr:delta and Notch-like epidermal growth factor-related receptor isoform X1 [Hippoglossus hippoglossus]XP_034460418.1 delta and Notch-like epidermal growth factor-related receptor isoform X1 [Hippoglossus hippoglossus]XP_035009420.2 delta and Notch-like epidermal growth factor-related receptor [Hippoglossus stenolepis]